MFGHLRLLLSCGALAAVLLAGGAEPAAEKPGDEPIDAYLKREAAKLDERVLDGATTREEWEARRPRLRQEYFDMLGLWPLPEKTPLHPTVTGTLERGGVVIEKLHFQSRPGLYVTGDLFRPKAVEKKLPAILYVCGHSHRGRDGNKTAYQDQGMWFASNGYVCLVIDSMELGEIAGKHHGTYDLGRWWWHSAGYTPAGVECWNGVRAIDYLVSRPDVDAERIGVTGISGGGAATFWIAAADERVKCAVPVSGMSDLECYVSQKVIDHHCDCMLLYNTYGWEWTTIAELIAPRPLLFANSDADSLFPMDGNRRIIDRLRQLYKLYDKSDLVDDYVSTGGHAYRPDLRLAVYQWINKHLNPTTGPVKDADFAPIPDADLRVFPEDKDIPADAINGKIDETFVPRADVALPKEGEFEAWKKWTNDEAARAAVPYVPRSHPGGANRRPYPADGGEPSGDSLGRRAERGGEKGATAAGRAEPGGRGEGRRGPGVGETLRRRQPSAPAVAARRRRLSVDAQGPAELRRARPRPAGPHRGRGPRLGRGGDGALPERTG